MRVAGKHRGPRDPRPRRAPPKHDHVPDVHNNFRCVICGHRVMWGKRVGRWVIAR